jgi:CHRD domain-containing protein
VTGTIRPSDVVGPTGQGIAAGEFEELVAAIRAGRAYANVHSAKFPGGEIRGQINDDDQRDD